MAENLNKPGVYRGQQKLATQQDLALLRQELRQLIAGPISEVSENGYIPWKYNTDGSLDLEYLFPEMVQSFEENTGISITRNGISYANNIKSLNFAGNYVFLSLDESGSLVVEIRPPKQETSRFNEVDGITDSIIRIKNEILSGAIIPDSSNINSRSIYGDWEPGSVQEYINWNGSLTSDYLTLTSNESIFASDLASTFEIVVFDGYNSAIGTFLTKAINGNKGSVESSGSGNSFHISVKITDFKEEKSGFSFKPEFKFNLIGLIGSSGGRFHIKIIHHDGNFNNSYISKDYLYNVGTVPTIGAFSYDIITDPSISGCSIFTYCSGLKYILNGALNIKINNIKNLNNLAAIDNKVEFNFDCSNQIPSSSNEFNDYDLTSENICSWKALLFLNDNYFSNSYSAGSVSFKNAFGESEKFILSVPLLLNSQKELKNSDQLNEYFSDESFRVKNSFEKISNNSEIWTDIEPWDSTQNLIDYDNGTGLMVIPGQGLIFPSGNWTSFIPKGSPNYEDSIFKVREKFFSRIFTGNSKLKFGGKFIFKGITKSNVLDSRFDCMISPDQGITWYSLKHIRGVETVFVPDTGLPSFKLIGIMTEINDIEDGVEISWMYPSTMSWNTPIYFKVGFKPTSPFVIKSISLINLDNNKEW